MQITHNNKKKLCLRKQCQSVSLYFRLYPTLVAFGCNKNRHENGAVHCRTQQDMWVCFAAGILLTELKEAVNLKPQQHFRIISSRYLNDPFRRCASDGCSYNIVLFNMVINWIYTFLVNADNMRLCWWRAWKMWRKEKKSLEKKRSGNKYSFVSIVLFGIRMLVSDMERQCAPPFASLFLKVVATGF